jgi:hypothetical protein
MWAISRRKRRNKKGVLAVGSLTYRLRDFGVRDTERGAGGGGREEHVGAADYVVHGLEEEDAAGYAEEERDFRRG